MKRSAKDDDCFISDVKPRKSAKTSNPDNNTNHPEQGANTYDQKPKARRSKKKQVDSGVAQIDGDPQPKEEKRLRRYRKKAPQAWLEIRERALTQRMYALDRKRHHDHSEHPTESISLAGTTGNVYKIIIDKVPSCDCPHAAKGNQCKHIAYVLSRVLRVKRSELEYQLAFTSSELCEIFQQAPALPSQTGEESEKDGNRKTIEGECPICVVDFEPDGQEKIVYCKASCGNNIHETCFRLWAKTKTASNVTCPFCRSPWQEDVGNLQGIDGANATKNEEGYLNVASQLGMSGRRDYSSYNSFWMRQQLRSGEIGWDEEGAMNHDYYR